MTSSCSATRQTLNLDEFGLPFATGVTDPFNLWRFQVSGRETLFDLSTLARLRSAKDSALAVGADARAYLLTRPYLKHAVRVEILDQADPTPYWVIGTRAPESLAKAIEEARREVLG